MLNRKQCEDWIGALRSGRYKQTAGTLRNDEGFCCLGVLACRQFGNQKVRRSGLGTIRDLEATMGHKKKDFLLTNKQESTLITMNDDNHSSFNEIADYIEKKILPRTK